MRVRTLAALILAAGTLASAGTIDSNTIHFSIATGTVSGNFTQFDPSLGTLTGVTVVITNFSSQQVMTVSNIGGGSTSVLGIFEYHGDLTLPGYTESGFLNPAGSFGVGCSGSGEIASCTQTDTYPPTPEVDSWTDSITPSSLSGYIGNGTLPLSILVQKSAVVQSYVGSSPSAFHESENMTGDLTLRYSYDAATPGNPTPEPASMVLLGSALAGIAVMFRRRNRA